MSDDGNITYWLAQLKSVDVKERIDAADYLRQLQDEQTLPALVEALDYGGPYSEFLAVSNAVLSFGPAAVPVLVNALKSAKPGFRGYLIQILGYTEDQRALPHLLESLDQDDDLSSMASPVLSYLGSIIVLPLIERVKTHPNLRVRRNAMRALSGLNDPRVETLALEYLQTQELRFIALDILGNPHGVENMLYRIDLVASYLDDPDASVRTSAILALGRLRNERAVDILVARLNVDDPDITTQANIIGALTTIPSPRVVEPLINLLHTPLAEFAIDALGQIGDQRAVAPIATLHKSTTDKRLRLFTVEALMRLGFFPTDFDPSTSTSSW